MKYFKTEPRPHQQKEFDLHRNDRKRALLWRMRSGKSKAAIDLANYLFLKNKIDAVLIVAPNGVHNNWVRREFPTHSKTPFKAYVFHSDEYDSYEYRAGMINICRPSDKKIPVLSMPTQSIYTKKSLETLKRFLKTYNGRVFLIIDEVHYFRTPSSKRTQRMKNIAKVCKWARALTGTLVANTPLAAWSQFELLEYKALGYRTYTDFQKKFAIYKTARAARRNSSGQVVGGRQYQQIVGYKNLDLLKERIARWSSIVLTEDCVGMSPLELSNCYFDMTEKQAKIYKKLVDEYILENAGYDGGARALKLQQIARGWYRNDDAEIIDIMPLKDNPSLIALQEEILTMDGKIIIWCHFRKDIENVVKTLNSLEIPCVEYHGGVKARERVNAYDSFTNNKNVRVFVGQPIAGGDGLDLSVAQNIIWYSRTRDQYVATQATARASKIGGGTVNIVDMLARDTIDHYIKLSAEKKDKLADMLSGKGLKDLLQTMELV